MAIAKLRKKPLFSPSVKKPRIFGEEKSGAL
jgi:hypothetical protein